MNKNKFVTLVVTISLLVALSGSLISTTSFASAVTNIPEYLYVMGEPSPVGVGQTVYISLFFTKPIPPVGSAWGGGYFTGLTVNVVSPSGHNTTLGHNWRCRRHRIHTRRNRKLHNSSILSGTTTWS